MGIEIHIVQWKNEEKENVPPEARQRCEIICEKLIKRQKMEGVQIVVGREIKRMWIVSSSEVGSGFGLKPLQVPRVFRV